MRSYEVVESIFPDCVARQAKALPNLTAAHVTVKFKEI
jgi:hypothetical protein